jgi:hypothetical protein
LKAARGLWLNLWSVAVNRQDYIARLQTAVSQLHECGAIWRESVPVHEVFRGQTVWDGLVEVFDLNGHPKAKRAYAWSHREGENNAGERFVAVLEIPPVDSAVTAVQVSLVKQIRNQK